MEQQHGRNPKDSKLYKALQLLARYMDGYHIDAVMGLLPGGFGDVASNLISLVYVYFSLFEIRSIPLTLAVVNNILRDVFLGLVPFFVGDVVDFFFKSNQRNMRLIDGFLDNDEAIIKSINRKAAASVAILIALIVGIVLMFMLLAWTFKTLGTVLFA